MRSVRLPRFTPVLAVLAALAALDTVGCDAGGLLVVTPKEDAGVVLGPPVTEIVSGGTVASNGKHKIVFTLGQPTPNQGPATGPNNRDNGGIVGAMNGP